MTADQLAQAIIHMSLSPDEAVTLIETAALRGDMADPGATKNLLICLLGEHIQEIQDSSNPAVWSEAHQGRSGDGDAATTPHPSLALAAPRSQPAAGARREDDRDERLLRHVLNLLPGGDDAA